MENENIKLNLPPFYVGQRVVAVVDHSQSLFKKGDEFSVQGLKTTSCCGAWVVNIGFSRTAPTYECRMCHRQYRDGETIHWFSSIAFAPLEERFISLAEVIKIESPLTCVN